MMIKRNNFISTSTKYITKKATICVSILFEQLSKNESFSVIPLIHNSCNVIFILNLPLTSDASCRCPGYHPPE